jgi:2-methylcitrate dehydratase PrpD
MTATQTIAAWAAALRDEDIPESVRAAAELHALDVIGCALAAHGVGAGEAVRGLAHEEAGAPQASAIGLADRVPAASAALVNGTLAHTLDFDDTHDASVCHVSAVVVPAALAVGEAHEADARAIRTAIIAGNEVVCRLGAAAPRAFHARGFHPTSVCGVFGATVAAARLRGLDAAGIERALGLAGSLASGLFAFLADGSPTKPLHAGWAAAAGVRAAALADHGLRGPAAILEDRFGLFAAYAEGEHDIAGQLADLGSRWETPAIAFKAYPACHYIHGALDALAQLGPLDPAAIERVDVKIAAAGAPLVCEPRSEKLAPATPYGARFSLNYALAALIVHGLVDATSFTESAIGDPDVLALAARIHADRWAPGEDPSTFAGAVSVTLSDATTRSATAAAPAGLDAAGVRDKARRNAALAGVELTDFDRLTNTLGAVASLSTR